jgi:glutamate:GABA antiporter
MYVLMFLSAIKLRYSHDHVFRPYRIPFKKPGIWTVGGLGILSSTFAFFISFIPPGQIDAGNIVFYDGFLIIGLLVTASIPMVIYSLKKENWQLEVTQS